MQIDLFETDVLVIGGGMAAMRAAIAAADAGVDVIVVTKAPAAKSGASTMAGGGIAAAMGIRDPSDSPEAHYNDIVKAGRGLADPELARILAQEAPARVRDLVEYGVRFRLRDGKLEQVFAPGHSYPRVLHTLNGGSGFVNLLRRKMLGYPNVHLHDDVMAVRLFSSEGRVAGALCLDVRSSGLSAFAAGATIIATGGYQDIYPTSSASCDVTGDGYVMAFDAGADLVDFEMLLYYPTALLSPASLKGMLIMYEMFLQGRGGPGARLVNVDGEDLLDRYDRLPIRDELARRIFEEVNRGKGTEQGGVFVDVGRSTLPVQQRIESLKRIPSYPMLTALGFDVAEGRFEVGPAAHTVLGGIRINSRCESTVPGLYAAGEAAGNIHGANRLGGNALAETQVFGFRAGKFAAEFARSAGRPRVSGEQVAEAAQPALRMFEPKADSKDALDVKNAIRETMFRYVGPARSEEGIAKALRIIETVLETDIPRIQVRLEPAVYNYSLVEALEADLMARAAALVCHAARLRRESRGHHYRTDFPALDEDRPPHRTRLRQQDGAVVAELYPVS